jgi:protoporphyrinogen oxidase
MRVLIIGAGPTGLGAAYRLQELGHTDWRIYEASDHVGGLASSVESNGFVYDTGGHVLFSHYEYFDRLVEKLLGNDFTEIRRNASIFLGDRFVPYPFQNSLRHLAPEMTLECILGLAEIRRSPQDAADFREWIGAVFGRGIARHFMEPYNWKVWAHPLELMDKQWMAERVSVIDLESALRRVIFEEDDAPWGPNSTFKFPLRGGTGGLFDAFLPSVESGISFESRVVEIDTARKVVRLENQLEDHYDVLLNTMPLNELVRRIRGVPVRVRTAAAGLSWSGALFVGLGIARKLETDRCWVYFPDNDCPFYRVTYLSRYSPFMAPDENHFSIITETSRSNWKPEDERTIIDRTIGGLVRTGMLEPDDLGRIVDRTLMQAEYAYPTPTLDRDMSLEVLQPYLMGLDIYSRGRFGAWLYEIGNMDHSVMQGVEFANKLLLGEPEKTWLAPRTMEPVRAR